MKINLVSEHASPLAVLGGGGAGKQHVHVASLAAGLAGLGAEVVVHTRRDDPRIDRRVRFGHGVVVDHIDAGPPEQVDQHRLLPYMNDFADELVRQWRRDRPDVVHAHSWRSGLATRAAARDRGVPVALTFHAREEETPACHRAVDGSADFRLRMEAWLATSVDQIISTSSAECRALVAAGVDPRRISVVPDGVDLCSFRPDGPRWPDRVLPHRVVSLSGLAPHTGVADLVEAVAGLPDVELLIAGGPPRRMLAEDACARELSAMIEASGSGGRIVLLGWVDRARLPGLLRSADVVACTPWYEPVRTVALEAMACGVPVVATGAGELAEPVVDGRTGILVPRRRTRSVQAAIATLLCQPARRTAMGRAGVRRASNYGWDDVAARTLHVVERLIAGAASVRPSADLPPRSCPRRTVFAPTRRRDVAEHHRIPIINAFGGTRAD